MSLGTNESRFDAIYFHPNTEYYAIAFGVAVDGYSVQDYSFITSGSVTISKTGDNYTIVVDAVDEHGHKITVNYKGTLEMDTNASAAYLSAITNSANQLCSVPNSFKRKYASKISMIKCNVA